MCKHAVLLALLALLVAVSRPARAQEPVLRTRIARLERELRNAEAAAAIAAASRSSATASDDTISTGALRVLAPTGVSREARAAVAEAWPLLDATFGVSGDALARHPFTLVGVARPAGTDSFEGAVHPVFTNGQETDILQRLLWAAAMVMAKGSDGALANWMQGVLVPIRDPADERRGVYVALVTASSPAARRCYLGDMDACRSVLGFVPVNEAVGDWYDAPRRRQIVRDLATLEQIRGASRAYTACVSDRSDGDCLALLRGAPPGAIPPPLPSTARSSLVRTAVQLGGRGAYARLLASTGRPIEQRLAVASGVSGDSVLQAWHAAVLASRPQQVSVEARDAWVALAWGVAFGLLALRSSRWR